MPGIPGADGRVIPVGTGGAARQALRLLAVGMLAGLLLGATPLRQWSESLPDAAAWVTRAAGWWEAQADDLGLTRPYASLRSLMRDAGHP